MLKIVLKNIQLSWIQPKTKKNQPESNHSSLELAGEVRHHLVSQLNVKVNLEFWSVAQDCQWLLHLRGVRGLQLWRRSLCDQSGISLAPDDQNDDDDDGGDDDDDDVDENDDDSLATSMSVQIAEAAFFSSMPWVIFKIPYLGV